MTTSVCAGLSAGPVSVASWMPASMLESPSVSLCRANVAHHFSVMFQQAWFSCSDRHVGEMVLVYVGSFNIFFALLVILISYVFIFITGSGEALLCRIPRRFILHLCLPPGSSLHPLWCSHHDVLTAYSSSHSMDTDKLRPCSILWSSPCWTLGL